MLAQLYRQTWGVCLQRRGSFRRRSPSALPKEFVGSNRWGKSDIIRYSMFFYVFFGGGNNIRHAKSQVCLEFGSHRQFRRCETEHVSEADLNLIGAAGISWVFASLSSPSGRWMSGKTCRNWWSRTWSTQLLGHQRAMNRVCFQTGKTEEAQSGVLTQSILKSFRYAQLKTVLSGAQKTALSHGAAFPVDQSSVARYGKRQPCEASFSYMRKADPKDPVKFQKTVQKVLKRQDNMVELMTLVPWPSWPWKLGFSGLRIHDPDAASKVVFVHDETWWNNNTLRQPWS